VVRQGNSPLSVDIAKEIAAYLQRAGTERVEEMSADLDTHPLFAGVTGEQRRRFRRLVQEELLRRPDSMVSRWLRIGGRVDYDENFHAVLCGTPALAELVASALINR
jgi:hypothetical protein